MQLGMVTQLASKIQAEGRCWGTYRITLYNWDSQKGGTVHLLFFLPINADGTPAVATIIFLLKGNM